MQIRLSKNKDYEIVRLKIRIEILRPTILDPPPDKLPDRATQYRTKHLNKYGYKLDFIQDYNVPNKNKNILLSN